MHQSEDNPFKITATPEPKQGLGRPITETSPSADPTDRVRLMVESSDIFLLIKGTPQRPQCGFSANTVAIIESLGIPYQTFPQVYVKGEFIGGNDILMEMYDAGEIQELVAGVDV